MIGTTLSHFRIVDKIGEGGMGVVYRAEDTKLRREVALKVLPPDLVANEERRLRFLREARTAAAINHPNIATIYEVDEADGVVFIAMELVEGKTLRDHIGAKPMAIKDSLRIATEMAEGLAKAHGAHVIHRDFKPDNVIVTADGHVKILDFGLAKLLEDPHEEAPAEMSKLATLSREMTREGKIFGTPAYMSPEQARGQRLDTRSDLFAIGSAFYEMLTGRVPFQGRTNTDILSGIIRDEPFPLTQARPEVPPELERIVAKCLEKDPADRYQDTSDLVVDLRHLRRTTAAHRPGGPGSQSPELSDPSIAVLPFTNMSADPEDVYLSDGLTEDIINALTQIKGLRVAARSSRFAFRGKDVDIARVGARLNVATVLEGSVRRAGERLRITAQFIDVASGYQLWSKRFDCTLDDIFAMQDETARAIADRLQIELIGSRGTSPHKGHTPARDSHDLYMRGRYFCYRRDREGLRRSLEYFTRATEADPDYPLPHVGISDVYWSLAIYLLRPHAEVLAKGRQAVDRALELDPDLAEAHASSGINHMMRGEWSPAEKELKKALDLAPQLGLAAGHYAFLLGMQRRVDEIGQWVQRALDAEPLSHYNHGMGGWAYCCAKEFEEAIRYCRMGLEIDPNSLNCCNCLAMCLVQIGRPDEGLPFIEKVLEQTQRSPFAVCVLGHLHGRAGRTDEARAVLAELRERSSSEYVHCILEGAIHVGMGDRDRARPFYELALREGCPPFYFTAFGRPFPEYLHELGLPS